MAKTTVQKRASVPISSRRLLLPGASLPAFLRKLTKHNDRAWFKEHGDEYSRVVAQPLAALVSALEMRMGRSRPTFQFGRGAITRPWRDPRFGSGAPLHETAYLRFREACPRVERVHLGVRFTTTGVLLEAGYRPRSPAGLLAVREAIARRPKVAMRILRDDVGIVHEVAGAPFLWTQGEDPELTRAPRGLICPPSVDDLVRCKAWTRRASCWSRGMDWQSLPDRVADAFDAVMPFVRYLSKALDSLDED